MKNVKDRVITTTSIAMLVLSLPPALADNRGEEHALIGFSLQAAQRRAVSKTDNRELELLGGIQEIIGAVLDDKTGDVILLGRASKSARPVSLSDLVVALRCADVVDANDPWRSSKGPGVSLEPRKSDATGDKLDVVFFGGAANTSLGMVTFQADYQMKQIAMEKIPSGIPELETYAQRTRKAWGNGEFTSWNVLSRFWFKPIFTPIKEDEVSHRIFFVFPAEMGVFVELISAEINGQPVQSGFRDEPAERYARQFMQAYRRIAQQHAEFRELARYAGYLKLMLVLLQRADPDTMRFWRHEYVPVPINTPIEVPLIRDASENGRRQLTLVGGVRMAGLTLRLRSGELGAVRDAVLLARPSADALTWSISFDKDWKLTIPSISPEDHTLANDFTDGVVAYEKSQYAQAMQAMDRVLRLRSDVVEARYLRALCTREVALRQGNGDSLGQAIAELEGISKEWPQLIAVGYELASTYRAVGRTEEAIKGLQGVLKARKDYAPAYHGLALAYLATGDKTKAVENLREYLRLEPARTTQQAREAEVLMKKLTSDGPIAALADYRAFTDEKYRLSCKYPADWNALRGRDVEKILSEMADARNTIVAFLDPASPGRNVTIQITPIDAEALTDKDIEEAIPELESAHRAHVRKFEKVEAGAVTIGGVKGVRFVMKHERAGAPIEQCIITLVKARKAYTITCTAPVREYDGLWNSHFDRIVHDVKIE